MRRPIQAETGSTLTPDPSRHAPAAARLTRRLSSSQRADSFFGTDLSYEDVEPKRISDYEVVWPAEDATTPDQKASALEAGCQILSHNIQRLGTEEGISAYFWGSTIRGVAYLEKVIAARERLRGMRTS